MLSQVPMSLCAAKLVHQIASMADPAYELLEAYRSRERGNKIPQRLPVSSISVLTLAALRLSRWKG